MADGKLFHSATFKVLGIGFLALLLLIPLALVNGLISERSSLKADATWRIAERWGGAQILGGPVLVVPRKIKRQDDRGWHQTVEEGEVLLADTLTISGTLAPDVRRYGIYETPVYSAELQLRGRFSAADLALPEDPSSEWLWQEAELRLPVADVRGIHRLSRLVIQGMEYDLGPSSEGVEGFAAVALPLDLSSLRQDAIEFSLDMNLAGTESLRLLPLARRTSVELSAPWNDPSFTGAFLPNERKLANQAFSARWQVLDLNRNYGQRFRVGQQGRPVLEATAFGVELFQPVNIYQQNERAGKYGVLFVALTFMAFFMFEVLKRLRVHPVQYLLVGLALATFYLVLLALSEHLGFTSAYLAAASTTVLMLAGYATAVLGGRRAGATLGGLLAVVYGLLYGLVVNEHYALLMGALALLGILALVMYLTRGVDWYRLGSASVDSALRPGTTAQ